MSYCVNCGVELDPSAKTCPLCGTPAWHPELDAPPYFPANSAAVQPASRREAAILLTAMLAVCVGLIIPLRIVRRVPSLREEARRRFNL